MVCWFCVSGCVFYVVGGFVVKVMIGVVWWWLELWCVVLVE